MGREMIKLLKSIKFCLKQGKYCTLTNTFTIKSDVFRTDKGKLCMDWINSWV